MMKEIIEKIKEELENKTKEEQIEFLNKLRKEISELSPFSDPVDCIQWTKIENIRANAYNPNKVATPEMNLLHLSIQLDGFTQPIVAFDIGNADYEIVDGFHRSIVGQMIDIKERTHGYLPLTIISKPLDERMGSTIRHNRARGTHQIRGMSDLVVELSKVWSDKEIGIKLGMEEDEVIRLKQISGLKEAFSNHVFSKSWEEFESKLKEKY